jgi:hypothetical protein
VAEEGDVIDGDRVMEVARGFSTTLVASSLPPNPVSRSNRSAGVSEKARKAAAVRDLEESDQLAGIGSIGTGEAVNQPVLMIGGRSLGPAQ